MMKKWLFVLALLVSAAAGTSLAGEPASKGKAEELFGLTKVHEFHLEFAAKQWEKMQPAGGPLGFPGGPGRPGGGRGGFPGGPGGPGGFPGGPAGPEKPAEKVADTHRGSGFGME